MKRGDIVVVSAPGAYGKPRPAVVVQADVLTESGLGSVVVCLLSSVVVDVPLFRITIELAAGNGLEKRSQVMVDKLVSLPREKITQRIGSLDGDEVLRLNRTLAFVLGLG